MTRRGKRSKQKERLATQLSSRRSCGFDPERFYLQQYPSGRLARSPQDQPSKTTGTTHRARVTFKAEFLCTEEWTPNSLQHKSSLPSTDSMLSSKWLRDLPALPLSSNRIPKLSPANRNHCIPRLALRHDDTKLVSRRRQIII